ncbi:MAG: hypothetical protein J6S20_01785 [Paludibacteraceae bacterium]|nr:hypothetical protein [Paludibacteraceae bacterium]
MRLKTILVFLFFTVGLLAQNNTNSPYTRYGYGRLDQPVFGRAQAMGGLSYAMRSNAQINPANPASYSAVDTMTFMFDIGASASLSNFSMKKDRHVAGTANLDYLAAQFSATKWLGFSFGLIPFSSVGYDYETKSSVNGDSITSIYKGTGGITQLYLGVSFLIWKRFALGANAYYSFGEINHSRNLTFGNSSYTPTQYSAAMNVNSFSMRFGFQYTETFLKKHTLTAGFVYDYKANLNGKFENTLIDTDTILTSFNDKKMEMPAFYGAGLSYQYDKRLTVGVDYSFREFAKARYYGKTDSLKNSHRITLGAEYMNDPFSSKYIDRICWRAGGYLTNSYIGQKTLDYGVAIGVGFPLRASRTTLNVTLEYNKIGKNTVASIREDYFKFSFNATINETWFFKSKIK